MEIFFSEIVFWGDFIDSHTLSISLDCRGTCTPCRTSTGRETGRAVLGGRDGVYGYATEAEYSG